MRTSRTRTATVAVALAAVGTLFAMPTAAHAAAPSPVSTAAPGQGLERFQERHGLPSTGEVDRRTAEALRQAPDSELRQTFRTAADLGPEELANARTVIGVGKGAGIPEQGQVIALMTAMQESKFVNYLTPVDHDSLGIFQQRPSMGWGTPEQITDVPTSSKSFYGVAPFGSNPGLIQIQGWETMAPGDVCQAVQRSAYPDRYAQWEQFARDLLARESPTVPPIP
ncbi:peptidoglycan-binding protein [Streptomyces sp. AJS327]|uniref:peptidoglycan-binding protein n=1 Tax=Streptomyces sp. AJS327 TaxID=2545265 RepID=UPI0015E05EAD|nr:peptidoglycan-binding domain-containing protein [Streptomyces sp. AJS327]MBA0051677.1 peptidoglycan-binding protein [Streptomyces sp. AJS327]